jgi:hypothetical protein
MSSRDKNEGVTHLLGLAVLILLPMSELLIELLDGGRDVGLAGRCVNADLGELLNDTDVQIELGSGRGSTSLLAALLALLATSAHEVVLLLSVLLGNAGTLDLRGLDGTLSGGSELASRCGLLSGKSRRVEVTDETLGGVDLVLVCGCAGFLETLLSSLLALASEVLDLLLLPALVAGLASLEVVLLEGTLLLVVLVLQFLPRKILLLLLGAGLVGGLTESLQVLESLVLLGLQAIQLGLELCVFLAEGLLLGVVEELLLLSDLSLEVVDGLLLRVEAREVLARLVERGDLGKSLLLVDELHHARVDLLLQAGDLLVDILGGFEVDAALVGLELVQARLELLVELLHLLEDGIATGLVALLGLADSVQLSLELLLALGIGRVLVVRAGGVELGLSGVLGCCQLS